MQITVFRFRFLILLIWAPMIASATHNRAGEITYEHVSGYTFDFTVSTYTYYYSQANRNELTVSWGDGTTETVSLTSRERLPNDYLYNTYTATHTFPGAGTYQILMEDPNRNLGVKNIPNSVNTIFSITTTMLIGTSVGTNSTPTLLNAPIDKAALNQLFIHNPSAYDADGDSLSYEITVCTADDGDAIEGYSLPDASDTIYVDEITGNLIWDAPVDTGIYNVAMYINEWRNNIRIGKITRDMQINVYETENTPPVNGPIRDYCIEAGDTLEFYITATDADGDSLEQSMTGTPSVDGTGEIETVSSGKGYIASHFSWATNCSHARKQPHNIIIKTADLNNDINLVDISNFNVTVIPNAPENLNTDPGTDQIILSWDVSDCDVPYGYNIYRRKGSYYFTPDSCENGVPEYTGYEYVDFVLGAENIVYTDDNQGEGLVPGFDYCYRITAVYEDGMESFASDEACAQLVPGVPPMLQVSVLSDDESNGEIAVKWAYPRDFDTVDDGPYRYELYRMAPDETDYSLLTTITTEDLKDTAYTDAGINTMIYPYYYSARLVYLDDNNEWVTHPGYETASSLYLDLIGKDNNISISMEKRAPWLNTNYDIYRSREANNNFEFLDTTSISPYVDDGLPNEVNFTYRVISTGSRPLNDSSIFITYNTSHIATTMAVDSIAPCAPEPEVESFCDSSYNFLAWTTSKSVCGDDDVIYYEIYYRSNLSDDFELIATKKPEDTTFVHQDGLETLAAQYGVVAVDSFNNKSDMAIVTIDTCNMYALPNVFSPNNDSYNDIYLSYNPGGFVKEVDMKIFNRYGQSVYETTDADINWDGRAESSGEMVSTGVYYYICDYYEPRITGPKHKLLKGFIHVFSDNSNKTISE